MGSTNLTSMGGFLVRHATVLPCVRARGLRTFWLGVRNRHRSQFAIRVRFFPSIGRATLVGLLVAVLSVSSGCGSVFPQPAPLFTVPLTVEGQEVAPAIVDTGGGFEILLKESFGLPLLGRAEVLAFGGSEVVEMTTKLTYSAGGYEASAPFALVGISSCECNGIGFHFFRKTGLVLGIDFETRQASFETRIPQIGTLIPFSPPVEPLSEFDSSFIDVEIGPGFDPPGRGEGLRVLALVDTGSNITAMRRGLIPTLDDAGAERIFINIDHPLLGTLVIEVLVFDTPGLPDVILGTNAMQAWGDQWYFIFGPQSGAISVTPRNAPAAELAPQ